MGTDELGLDSYTLQRGVTLAGQHLPETLSVGNSGFPTAGEARDRLTDQFEKWSDCREVAPDENRVEALMRNVLTGRPVGVKSVVDRIDNELGRELRPNKRGRKRKADGKE